ncbi:hypothetical protein D3C85_1496270 [compost metagenome]
MKAPMAPTVGAMKAYTPPKVSATKRAIAIGMLSSWARLTPELIMMRTIGMVNTSTKPAPSSTLVDSPMAVLMSFQLMRCRKKVTITTITRMPPGRYSGSMAAVMPASPMMSPLL